MERYADILRRGINDPPPPPASSSSASARHRPAASSSSASARPPPPPPASSSSASAKNKHTTTAKKYSASTTPESINQEELFRICGNTNKNKWSENLKTLEEYKKANKRQFTSSIHSKEKETGYTCLHYAAKTGNIKLIDFLLRNGANLNAKDSSDSNPFYSAYLNQQTEAMLFLLNNGSSFDRSIVQRYLRTKEFLKGENQRKLVELLLKKVGLKFKYEISNETIIAHICKHGDLETLQFVFQCFDNNVGDINSEDNRDYHRQTPLFNAVLHNKLDISDFLLQYGADINTPGMDGNTLFQFFLLKRYSQEEAEQERASDMLNYLLSKHDMGNRLDFAHQNGEKNNVFHIVAKNNDMESARFILSLMVDEPESVRLCINAHASHNRYTPLHYACYYNFIDMVEWLLSNGANVDSKDSENQTPLRVCCIDVVDRVNEINRLNRNEYSDAYGSVNWRRRMLYLRKRFVIIYAMIDLLLAFGSKLESITDELDALPSFEKLFRFYREDYRLQFIYASKCPICWGEFQPDSDIVLLLPVIKNNVLALPATDIIEQPEIPPLSIEPPAELYLCHHMYHRECIVHEFELRPPKKCPECRTATKFTVNVQPAVESQAQVAAEAAVAAPAASASQSNGKKRKGKSKSKKGGNSNKGTRKIYQKRK